jgi:tRNA (guanine37-N1)-methyltransferase
MRFDIVSLFPEMIQEVLSTSILKRAQTDKKITIHTHNIRDYALDKHRTVDDTPYGGGAGMLLKVDVLVNCIRSVTTELDQAGIPAEKRQSVLLCPQGSVFTQRTAEELAQTYEQVTLICGHYEGFDERIRSFVDRQVSLGDFVLTGGELPAMVIVDAISRLVPGVIAKESPEEESHSIQDAETGEYLLEYPHYTRPADFEGMTVPDVLLSGNHAQIAAWRMDQARLRTKISRHE